MLSRRAVTLFVALALLAFAGGATRGQDKDNPIVKEVKSNLKDPTKPFTMVVRIQLKDGASDKFEASFAKAIKGTRKEKGCTTYDLNRDPRTPGQYFVYERWQNLAALESHMNTDHITTLLKEIGDLLANPPEVRVFLPASE